jgi:ABC-type nitrate/sulfonate/bicarbonate transport system permease component
MVVTRAVSAMRRWGCALTRPQRFLLRWGVFLALVTWWQLVTAAIDHPYFPPPLEILAAARQMWFSGTASTFFLSSDALDSLLPSIGRLLGGWWLAVLAGVVLGTALGLSRRLLDYAGPVFAFFRSLPLPALVPVFVLLCRLGSQMVVAVILFGAVWAVLLNTVDGVRTVDRVQLDTARAFQIPVVRRLVGIVLPAALPKIFAGLRVSLSQSVTLMVVAELFAANGGLGGELQDARDQFDFAQMWAVVVMVGVLGYTLNTVLLAVERRALAWHQAVEGGQLVDHA